METFWTYFEVLAPSIGVGLIFWLAIRAIFRADRKERAMETDVREEILGGAEEPRHDGDQAGSAVSPGTAGSPRS
ncbi:hypothetical protein [Nesterenkonia sp. HG001]|uniref:hypothetical protein n=1 Tax=Nesterenkonia sp. HG001 TaxID=2983207 RepID=UPI002AC60D39|nr:hypothetical protein [Nesterenkonia sp. HG001]MDZ5078197.1 hypothetical protein [Nesterenkonia sp. HG001]